MTGAEYIGLKLPCGRQQVPELDSLIAANARDECLAAQIAIREIVYDVLSKTALIIEDIVGEAQASATLRAS